MMFTFDVKVSRFRKHTLTVYPVDGGYDVTCSCCTWQRLDEDGVHWCEGEGIWRIWVAFSVQDHTVEDVHFEEYCSSPFNFPADWNPAEYLVGTIDTRPAMCRESALIRAMEAGQ